MLKEIKKYAGKKKRKEKYRRRDSFLLDPDLQSLGMNRHSELTKFTRMYKKDACEVRLEKKLLKRIIGKSVEEAYKKYGFKSKNDVVDLVKSWSYYYKINPKSSIIERVDHDKILRAKIKDNIEFIWSWKKAYPQSTGPCDVGELWTEMGKREKVRVIQADKLRLDPDKYTRVWPLGLGNICYPDESIEKVWNKYKKENRHLTRTSRGYWLAMEFIRKELGYDMWCYIK